MASGNHLTSALAVYGGTVESIERNEGRIVGIRVRKVSISLRFISGTRKAGTTRNEELTRAVLKRVVACDANMELSERARGVSL